MINVIVPLAGKGTRFKALSVYNKCLLPYQNKEVLLHIVDNLKSQIDCNFIFVVNKEQESLMDFITANIENSTICLQEELNGPLGAIQSAINCDYFQVWNNTLIFLGDMITFDRLDFTNDFLSVQKVGDYSRWCMIDKDMNFYDKPTIRPNTNLALSGLYYFTNSKYLQNIVNDTMQDEEPLIQNEYQLSQMLKKYAKLKPFNLFEHNIIDIGTIDDFLRITKFKNCRDFHSLIETPTTIIKAARTSKLINESLHLELLGKIGWTVPNINSSSIFELKLEKLNAKTFEHDFIFEDKQLEYFEKSFDNIIVNLKNKQIFLEDVNKTFESTLISRKLSYLTSYLKMIDSRNVITHGDYHLGNIFLINDLVYIIDPSGRNCEVKNYDVAKLLHSIIYDYNLVKFNLYKINKDESIYLYNKHLLDKKRIFLHLLHQYYSKQDIKEAKIICMILFKSMQTLHSNEEHKLIFEKIHLKLKNEIDNDDFCINIWENLLQ